MIARWRGRIVFAYVRTRDGAPVVALLVADRLLATLTVDEAPGAVTIVVATADERAELRDVGLAVEPGGVLVRAHRATPAPVASGFPRLRLAA